MGYHTYASNEHNVAILGGTDVFSNQQEAIEEAEDAARSQRTPFDPATDPSYMLNGWWLHMGLENPYTGKLCPESYIGPNGEVVHVVNTSEYSMVGESDMTVFGPNLDHVRAFLQAIGFEGVEITPTDIVMQTI